MMEIFTFLVTLGGICLFFVCGKTFICYFIYLSLLNSPVKQFYFVVLIVITNHLNLRSFLHGRIKGHIILLRSSLLNGE